MSHPVIQCHGHPHDRGEAHGAQAAELVHDNIETYRRVLETRFGIAWSRARAHAARFVPWIREFDPELGEELRALAAGARADLEDVVLLNARSSLTLTEPEGCTALAYLPGPGEPARPLVAQNWDNLRRLRAVVLHVTGPGAPAIITLTEAGTLAKIGLNSEGVGIAVNGLHGPAPRGRAVPIFVLIRKALEARGLGDAVQRLIATPKDGPHHYLVGSRQGGALSVETFPEDHDILPPSGRFLLHTNHVLGPRFLVREASRVRHVDSVIRLWRARTLVAEQRGEFGLPEAREVLSDHFDAPQSICRHAEGEDDMVGETKCAVVMELTAGRLHASEGHPCKSTFQTVAFP